MIHNEIKAALQTLGIPVAFHTYNGSDKTYITYFQYDEGTNFVADDEEKAIDHFFQINLFSKNDYSVIIQNIKSELKEIGGIRVNETEFLNEDGYYQRSMRFKFTR